MLERTWGKGNLGALLLKLQIGAGTMKNSMEEPQKIKYKTTIWSSISISGNIFKGTQHTNSKEQKHPYVLCSIIYNYQDMEIAQVSNTKWADKTTKWHLHIGILLGHKKEENFTICDTMDGPGTHYVKWNKPVREWQTPYDFVHT